MAPQVIELLLDRKDLPEERAEQALTVRVSAACCATRWLVRRRRALTRPPPQALLEAADPAQTAAFLVLLRAKGETPAEIAGLARAMRSSGVPVDAGPGVLDIVGTGGDRRVRGSAFSCVAGAHACSAASAALAPSTSPLARASLRRLRVRGWPSTATARCRACAAAATWSRSWVWRCVQRSVRFGRRSQFLAQIELGPEGVGACVRDVGVGFMFAPRYHPAMKVCFHACCMRHCRSRGGCSPACGARAQSAGCTHGVQHPGPHAQSSGALNGACDARLCSDAGCDAESAIRAGWSVHSRVADAHGRVAPGARRAACCG